ncbi:MAG: tetratricopeptide repeat protein [Bacteroidota bacterium]
MKYLVSIAIYSLLGWNHSTAQDQDKIDSLQRLLDSKKKLQTQAQINLALAKEYKNSDTTSTFKYADEVIRIAKMEDLHELRSDALYIKGWSLMMLGDYTKSKNLFNEALRLSDRFGVKKGSANAYNGLGVLNTYQSNYYPALDYYFKSIEISKGISHREGIANCLNNIAIIYYYLGDNQSALDYSFQALEVKKELAIQREIALSYSNIGYFYGTLKDYENAKLYHQQALMLRKEIGDIVGLAESFSNMGEALYGEENFASAIENFKRALVLYDSIGLKADRTYSLIGLGKSYMELGKLGEAEDYLRTGLREANDASFNSNVRDAAFALAEVQKQKGNYREALIAYELFHETSDSLRNEEQTKKIARLETEFEFKDAQAAERERYEADIEERNSTQKLTYYFLSALTLVLGIVIFFNAKLKKLNRAVKRQKDDLESLNATKNRFFSIISHDLRGPVVNMTGVNDLINHHIRENYDLQGDSALEEITNYQQNASTQVLGLLDSLLKWALKEEGSIPFNPVLLNVNHCIAETCELLKPQALSKEIKLDHSLEGEIEWALDKNTFMTILRNLVSNSLKFTEKGGNILIQARKSDMLEVRVEDDGVGISADKMQNLFKINEQKVSKGTSGEQGTGLGLNLVYDFVKLNHGDITVESEVDQGTVFILKFPVQ